MTIYHYQNIFYSSDSLQMGFPSLLTDNVRHRDPVPEDWFMDQPLNLHQLILGNGPPASQQLLENGDRGLCWHVSHFLKFIFKNQQD